MQSSTHLHRPLLVATLLIATTSLAEAATIHVPRQRKTIQAAIDAAQAGDVVLVEEGVYQERIKLKAGVTLRSAGNDQRQGPALRRAERTVIDGGVEGQGPGVAMAEGSTLDGFTIRHVGRYDEQLWKQHHATQGEQQSHEHIGQLGTPAVAAVGATCSIHNNIVHHNGHTGIAIQGPCAPRVRANVCYRNMGGGIGSLGGSTAVIEDNVCYQNFYAGIGHSGASPLVVNNTCYENIRAGIGVSEGACPVVRANRCYNNRRAGIGVRTGAETAPVIEDNQCYSNDLAGIGVEEQARPVIRNNRCYKNAEAGIGCQDHAAPIIVGNDCYENTKAGIGSRLGARPLIQGNQCRRNKLAGIGVESEAEAVVLGNTCEENGTVAIGVRHGSAARIAGNTLLRTGGMPPMIAIREGSRATVEDNVIRGGGVAGVLLQGTAKVSGNQFHGSGPRSGGPPNFAVWVQAESTAEISDNDVDHWRHAVQASGAKRVQVTGNRVRHFLQAAIVVQKPAEAPLLCRNVAYSDQASDQVVVLEGAEGTVADNQLKPAEQRAGKKEAPPFWVSSRICG